MAPLEISSLLGPVIALSGWTFVVEIWMYATRLPAIKKYNVSLDSNRAPQQFALLFPPPVRWKADNYNHLMEQPTQFYAVTLALAIANGPTSTASIDVALAWAYVGIRVLHSLVQCFTNNIPQRFSLFVTSSGVLAALTARAAWVIFGLNA